VEGVLEGGEGDGDDGRIELAHESTDADGGDGEPVGVGPLTNRLRPPGFSEEAPPPHGTAMSTATVAWIAFEDDPTNNS